VVERVETRGAREGDKDLNSVFLYRSIHLTNIPRHLVMTAWYSGLATGTPRPSLMFSLGSLSRLRINLRSVFRTSHGS